MSGLAGAVIGKLDGLGSSISQKAQALLDSFFPPEKRAELLAKIKAFVLKNPKISAFLLTNIVLSGGPLVLFALFTISVFVFALIVALVLALLAAVAFTLLAVAAGLFILFPTVFFTTLTASFVFLWGLGGYHLFNYFNKGKSPAAKGNAIGDKLNALTGNHLGFVMDSAREGWAEQLIGEAHKDGDKGASPAHGPKSQQTNGTPGKTTKTPKTPKTKTRKDEHAAAASPAHTNSSSANGLILATESALQDPTNGPLAGATSLDGVVGDKAKGAPKKLFRTAGTAKGGATGALAVTTGLT